MLANLKVKLNLYEIDDMDVEEFRDIIYDNFAVDHTKRTYHGALIDLN